MERTEFSAPSKTSVSHPSSRGSGIIAGKGMARLQEPEEVDDYACRTVFSRQGRTVAQISSQWLYKLAQGFNKQHRLESWARSLLPSW